MNSHGSALTPMGVGVRVGVVKIMEVGVGVRVGVVKILEVGVGVRVGVEKVGVGV